MYGLQTPFKTLGDSSWKECLKGIQIHTTACILLNPNANMQSCKVFQREMAGSVNNKQLLSNLVRV
jgi:hypothetical protein